jgi:serine/threonine protein kinase
MLKQGQAVQIDVRYTLVEILGRGEYGEVWKVINDQGFYSAAKILHHPIGGKEAEAELAALEIIKALNHPHLLKTTDYRVLKDTQRLMIIVELADSTLTQRLKACQAEGHTGIPLKELLRYLDQSAEAFDYLHARGIYHRDVKPQNILLLEGSVKVGDFGLVYSRKQSQKTSDAAGTPAYMAPEAWLGQHGPASDQYSLAMTYAHLRLGRLPVRGNSLAEVQQFHAKETPDLSALPAAEREVLLQALAKTPDGRFDNCQLFARTMHEALPGDPSNYDLEPIAGTLRVSTATMGSMPDVARTERPTSQTYPGTPKKPEKPWFRRPLVLAACIGAAVAVGCLLGIFTKRKPSPQPYVEAPAVPDDSSNTSTPPEPSTSPAERRDPVTGEKIVFLLIQPEDGKPFYCMQNKVWNGLYRNLAQHNGENWTNDGGLKNGENLGSGTDRDHLPVLRVTFAEAQKCAGWLKGRLPTAKELDRAAGYRPGHSPGRSIGGSTPAIKLVLQGPRDVFDPGDESLDHHIHDLAGNGREWTTDILNADKEEVAVLRGRSYTASRPLLFDDLEKWNQTPEKFCPTQRRDHASPYTGFRVVYDP